MVAGMEAKMKSMLMRVKTCSTLFTNVKGGEETCDDDGNGTISVVWVMGKDDA